jgi:hypothetical protein
MGISDTQILASAALMVTSVIARTASKPTFRRVGTLSFQMINTGNKTYVMSEITKKTGFEVP